LIQTFYWAQHPNIVGVKLTCGNVGKLTRLVTQLEAEKFAVYGGQVDYLLAALGVGSNGSISGTANVAPKACVEIFKSYHKGDMQTAKKAQKLVAEGDKVMVKCKVVPGTKYALEYYFNYGGSPRKPVPDLEDSLKKCVSEDLKELMDFENSLPDL